MPIEYSLDRIQRVAEEGLDSPNRHLPYIHVTGTHGKGSTVALLQAALTNAGRKTGSFTSPHLLHPKDCIKIDGAEMTLYDWALWSVRVRRAAQRLNVHLSSFEVQCLVALCWFREQQVHLAILEVGMGGLLDATNVMDGEWQLASILTPIGLDHQEWLGPNLTDIASHKLGILRRNHPLIAAPQPPEITFLVSERASLLSCPVITVTEPYAHDIPLLGHHQLWNAAVAAACLTALSITEVNFAGATWPGRLSYLSWHGLSILCDGAHTPEAARTVRPYFEAHRHDKISWIIGHSGRRDLGAFMEALSPDPHDQIIYCGFSQPMGMDWIKAQQSDNTGVWAETIAEALSQCNSNVIIVTGSLYLISDLYRLILIKEM